ncbi:MAG: glycosyltransferase [Candidatus Omnitrophica bacterium]|nr:glycosyltransferase [Candidatus Omnitrophota bacterium]
MPKIKVLHIITRLDKGGSAENTLLTVSGVNKEKFKTTLISGNTNDPRKEIADFITQEKIDYILLPELIRQIAFLKDIKAFWKIYGFIKKGGFDIVHTHTSKAGILGRWAAKLAKVKIIIHTPHGHIFYGYFGWFKTKLFIYLERLTALITDRIITLTQRGKREHLRYRVAGPDKFVSIYSGIEVEKFTNFKIDIIKEREKLNIPSDALVIGVAGRLEPVKGNKYFISCLPDVVKVFPALKVFIVGGGSRRERLEQYVKNLNLSKNVIFKGECDDIRRIVSSFDVFVSSSLNEGMGRCLLEAQALGVPIAATNVGGVSEVVKDGLTGILVPARNPKAMAEAVINLLKSKSIRRDMSRQAKKWIGDKFSVKVMVEKITDLYEELMKEKQ